MSTEPNIPKEEPKRVSVSQEPRVKYKITPEEMWNCVKGSSENWGIEGYEIAKKYYDYRQVKWEQKRKEILNAHRRVWPPEDWPKNKEDKREAPVRLNFIDEQIKWAKSFNDPKESEEKKAALESRGTYKYPDPKKPINLREKFLNDEKEKKEKMAAIPQVVPWKENAIEDAKRRIEEAKSKVKTQWQKDVERYTKDKPLQPRADRVTVLEDAVYVGENIPFYYDNPKEEGDKKRPFWPNKEYTMHRNPAWTVPFKKPSVLPNDQMKARDDMIKEKVEGLKSGKNLTDKDLQIDILASHEKIGRRGRYYPQYHKPFDYVNTEQYKSNKEQHPEYSPGPQHYWKMKEGDTNTRPKETEEAKEVNGKSTKVYYMNRKRTDFRQFKPLRKSVF